MTEKSLKTLIFENTLEIYPPEPMPFEIECISRDVQAKEYFERHGGTILEHAFTIANILHMNKMPFEAACIYGLAFRIRSTNQDQYPLPQSLLQVRLLCFLKAGLTPPEHDLLTLSNLSRPYINYIEGIMAAWRGSDPEESLKHIGNAFEEFMSGEEIDWLYLEIAKKIHPSLLLKDPLYKNNCQKIPRKIFMYWDKNPPNEILENIYFHQGIPDFEIEIFDQDKASSWLYEYYGIEARELFLTMRHPAEAADFLRVHVTNLLGGWWLDADARICNEKSLEFLLEQQDEVILFSTNNYVIHNDFYGTTPQSNIMEECLRILYNNCYKHKHLYIAYKTGPGIFNRAISRTIFRKIQGIANKDSIKIYSQEDFSSIIEQIDAPYKEKLPLWQSIR